MWSRPCFLKMQKYVGGGQGRDRQQVSLKTYTTKCQQGYSDITSNSFFICSLCGPMLK